MRSETDSVIQEKGLVYLSKKAFRALFWICINTELRPFTLLLAVDIQKLDESEGPLLKEKHLHANFGKLFQGIHPVQKANSETG